MITLQSPPPPQQPSSAAKRSGDQNDPLEDRWRTRRRWPFTRCGERVASDQNDHLPHRQPRPSSAARNRAVKFHMKFRGASRRTPSPGPSPAARASPRRRWNAAPFDTSCERLRLRSLVLLARSLPRAVSRRTAAAYDMRAAPGNRASPRRSQQRHRSKPLFDLFGSQTLPSSGAFSDVFSVYSPTAVVNSHARREPRIRLDAVP
jgi:hypothetical protein